MSPTDFVGGWDNIIGHRAVIDRLRHMAAVRRVPHALLFYGLDGIGKKLVAAALTMSVLCENFSREGKGALPCGRCESCRRFAAGTHPDFLVIEPTGEKNKIIRIDAVRSVIAAVSRVPLVSSRRVAIIDGADRLNEQAANSLLKTLEEPPSGAQFILIAQRRTSLLPTILSRVTPIAFSPLSAAEVAAALSRQSEPLADAAKLAAIAQGSVGRALRLAADGGLERRADAKEIFSRLPLTDDLAVFAIGERLGALPRERLAEYFAYWRSFFHDLRRMAAGMKPLAADLAGDFAAVLPRWDAARLFEAEKLTAEAHRRLISSNSTARLAVEALIFQLGMRN